MQGLVVTLIVILGRVISYLRYIIKKVLCLNIDELAIKCIFQCYTEMLPSRNTAQPIVIVDYGAANGSTSLEFISKVIGKINILLLA